MNVKKLRLQRFVEMLPFFAFLIIFAGTVCLAYTEKVELDTSIRKVVEQNSADYLMLIKNDSVGKLHGLIRMSRRMAKRTIATRAAAEALWLADARDFLRDFPALRSVVWMDANGAITKAEPTVTFNEVQALINNCHDYFALSNTHRRPYHILLTFKTNQEPLALLIVPVSSIQHPTGYIAQIYYLQGVIDALGHATYARDYRYIFSYKGNVFSDNGHEGQPLTNNPFAIKSVTSIWGYPWDIQIEPRKNLIDSYDTTLPYYVLLFGAILGLSASAALWFGLEAKKKSKKMQEYLDDANAVSSILEKSSSELLIIDAKTFLVLYANAAACKNLSYSRTAILEVSVLDLLTEDKTQEWLRHFALCKNSETIDHVAELEFRRVNQSTYRAQAYLQSAVYKGIDVVFQTAIDITQREAVEGFKDQFISMVSHELRTPLTVVSGALQLLSSHLGFDAPEKVRRIIFLANRNSNRLLNMANQIIDIQSITDNCLFLNLGYHDPHSLLEQSILEYRDYSVETAMQIRHGSKPLKSSIYVDKKRLTDALITVLSNAEKFSNSGGVIDIWLAFTMNAVRFCVKDEGVGIAPSFQSHVFERFSQAEAGLTRRSGGSGLSLHLSREILLKMDSTIGFNSILEKGTTFWIEVPCKTDPSLQSKDIDELLAMNPLQPSSMQIRNCLIVSPDEALISILRNYFSGMDMVVHVIVSDKDMQERVCPLYDIVIFDSRAQSEFVLYDVFASHINVEDLVYISSTTQAPPRDNSISIVADPESNSSDDLAELIKHLLSQHYFKGVSL